MQIRAFLFLLFFSSISCQNPVEYIKVEVPTEATPTLVGTWEWILSEPPALTPHTEGYSRTVVFDSDSIYSVYQDSTLVLQTPFRVIRDTYPPFYLDTINIVVLQQPPGSRGDIHVRYKLDFNCLLELEVLVTDNNIATYKRVR